MELIACLVSAGLVPVTAGLVELIARLCWQLIVATSPTGPARQDHHVCDRKCEGLSHCLSVCGVFFVGAVDFRTNLREQIDSVGSRKMAEKIENDQVRLQGVVLSRRAFASF